MQNSTAILILSAPGLREKRVLHAVRWRHANSTAILILSASGLREKRAQGFLYCGFDLSDRSRGIHRCKLTVSITPRETDCSSLCVPEQSMLREMHAQNSKTS
jgi:hypothetical protein